MNVSVIVPAYNAQDTIEECLNSLSNQVCSFGNYEVIVVDDGSDDKTLEIVKSFPFEYIYQKNCGPATARNAGAKAAKNDIILFTDSDCVPAQNWIEEMIKPFNEPDVVAVKGAYRNVQKELVARFAQVEFEERFELLKKADNIDMVDTYSAGFRKEVFLGVGGFDISFPVANNEDTELSYKLSNQGHRMVFNPDAIVCHLDHPDSVKKYMRLKFWRGYWRMVVYNMYPDKMIKDSYTPQSLKLQILIYYAMAVSILLMPFYPAYGALLIASELSIFILSSHKFITLAMRKDITVGFLSPLLLLARAVAIGSGALWGIFRVKSRASI